MKFLKELGVKDLNSGVSTGSNWLDAKGEVVESYSPTDGKLIGSITTASQEDWDAMMEKANTAFLEWRKWPAPKRGEIVRQIGNELREHKMALGQLVSYEMGKSLQEGLGEVQEMIDIADFAVGLSRQLYGLTIQSERPDHRMMEQWQPLGAVGIISAFNFPVAVWSWNAFLAWVCGDVSVWKPSEKSPLCSVACQNIVNKVFERNNVPEGVSCIANGDYKVGQMMTSDKNIPLVSATGSTPMGRKVGVAVAERFGKTLLELGGNNAIIITESADADNVLIGAIF